MSLESKDKENLLAEVDDMKQKLSQIKSEYDEKDVLLMYIVVAAVVMLMFGFSCNKITGCYAQISTSSDNVETERIKAQLKCLELLKDSNDCNSVNF